MGVIREKKHRLDKEAYLGGVVVSFNIRMRGTCPLFDNSHIFRLFENHLRVEMKQQKCELPVYLFMPDHVHVVTQGLESSSDCLKAMKLFKQKTGYWISDNKPNYSWQKDFYDHIVRDDENFENVIYYILNNPVRAGITKNWKENEFKGSTIYNFDEWD